jgi:ribosomal protein S18 acetylase RimI-like enzyme
MHIIYRIATIDDYDQMMKLWTSSGGVGLGEADSKGNITRYMARNPGLSFVAFDADQLVGAALCGHDGRRGFIHHLAVQQTYRHQGIGKTLANRCLDALKAAGIDKCHLFVFSINFEARAFWEEIGWSHRSDLEVMSRYTTNNLTQGKP